MVPLRKYSRRTVKDNAEFSLGFTEVWEPVRLAKGESGAVQCISMDLKRERLAGDVVLNI